MNELLNGYSYNQLIKMRDNARAKALELQPKVEKLTNLLYAVTNPAGVSYIVEICSPGFNSCSCAGGNHPYCYHRQAVEIAIENEGMDTLVDTSHYCANCGAIEVAEVGNECRLCQEEFIVARAQSDLFGL